jgi:hypothetical protein
MNIEENNSYHTKGDASGCTNSNEGRDAENNLVMAI